MATKNVVIPNIGEITLIKRRGTRNIRLKVDAHGKVSVTLPHLIPYMVATEYAKSHQEWITEEQKKRTTLLQQSQKIGRLHTLSFIHDANADTPKGRVTSREVVIRHASPAEDKTVQAVARKTAIRALKLQAKHFLPKRLHDIALREDYEYTDVTTKQMKGRWGSCNQNKEIVLNIFLMELPLELIDYVILHELAHTRVLHHGPEFWAEMNLHVDSDAKSLRKQMRAYQPTVPAQSVT
jgi:predicted metal-dependent hydrolase